MKLFFSSKFFYFFLGVTITFIINLILTNCSKILIFWRNINHKYEENNDDNNLKTINCKDKSLTRAFKLRDHFWIFYNFVQAEKEFHCDESVTYTTPATYSFLDNLPLLVNVWKGPISVALYAPGDDFYTTLKSIAYLRNCETPLISQFVTFHLFFEENHFPVKRYTPLTKAYDDVYNCENGSPFKYGSYQNSYRVKHKLTFPINVARNVARETAQTHFIFPSDIELYPTPKFIEKFLEMILNKKDSFTKHNRPKVFVLPIFEVAKNETIPTTKRQLQKMIKKKKAILFHANICAHCHKVIKGNKWLNTKETEGLNIFAVGKRRNEYRSWEPIYVGTNNEPFFDERMTWEGRYDKMSQAYTLCLLNYDFAVLDNAFLIHKPGIKTVQDNKHKELVEQTKSMLINSVREKLNKIYGGHTNCAI